MKLTTRLRTSEPCARAIAARTKPRFIEIPRERGGGKVPFTEEQLTDMRGGLTPEEYRWN